VVWRAAPPMCETSPAAARGGEDA